MNSWKHVGRKGLGPSWKSSAMTEAIASKSATGLCADCATQDGQIKKSNSEQAYANERKTGFYVRETEQENMNIQTAIATAIAILILIGITVTVFWPLWRS